MDKIKKLLWPRWPKKNYSRIFMDMERWHTGLCI